MKHFSFPLATAQAVASDQRHVLIDEMRNALNYVILANTDSSLSIHEEQGKFYWCMSFWKTLMAINNFYQDSS